MRAIPAPLHRLYVSARRALVRLARAPPTTAARAASPRNARLVRGSCLGSCVSQRRRPACRVDAMLAQQSVGETLQPERDARRMGERAVRQSHAQAAPEEILVIVV